MAITASTISTSNTLEQFRTEFNNLRTDVNGLESGTLTFSEVTATTFTAREATRYAVNHLDGSLCVVFVWRPQLPTHYDRIFASSSVGRRGLPLGGAAKLDVPSLVPRLPLFLHCHRPKPAADRHHVAAGRLVAHDLRGQEGCPVQRLRRAGHHRVHILSTYRGCCRPGAV